MLLTIEVESVEGELLGNYLKLLHTLSYKIAHFLEDLLLGSAHMLTCNNRYRAVRAMTVTTLADLQIGIVTRCGEMTLTGILCHLLMTEVVDQFPIVELPVDLIHFGQFLLQLFGIAL